ncbi:GAF domain-containing protein [Flexibacter flexilis DSM 6793]|uniref:GAF domain-containing protein n=1 Tax=Flexibacter flexilis DSM 6793 TaxID=927664 RepID=A0A1I1DZ90_9BACT|nr:GAF domain-containing protein [Flexibacter flexilis]SFB79746.1 GAF domain-containing protein [Flexibacter flexilis DSM 6793]
MKTIQLSIRLPFYVGISCAIIVSIIALLQLKITNTYDDNLPLMAMSDNLKNKITKGHLWFEEYVAGDKSINPEKDVIALFLNSQKILQIAQKGGQSELGYLNKITDPNLEHLIAISENQIEEFVNITRTRQTHTDALRSDGEAANAGSQLDQQFDAKYDEIQESLSKLGVAINEKIRRDAMHIETWFVVALGMIVGIFMGIGWLIFVIQRKSEISKDKQEKKMAEDEAYIEQMTAFADTIGQGNYDADFSISEHDKLANSLHTMRQKLKTVADEDRKQNWANIGLAQMNDLLRQDSSDEIGFYRSFLTQFVKYTKANQAGLFLIREAEHTDPYLELVACVAYDRQKYLKKKMDLRDGLIGQAIFEKEMLYMTEIPQNYIRITSGLGDAPPSHLLIIPLIYNDQTYGAIEMASFFAFEKHHRDFIQKIAENLASTVGILNTNVQTKKLLESVQAQTQKMRVQEEEMRQNLEELSATQEELIRKEKHYLEQLEQYRDQRISA